jgi:outer membrane protein TolC
MLSKQTLAALVVATLSTGCAVGPDYARPEPVLAQQFHGQAAVEQRQAASSADLAQWWTGFGDPQLSRFVALALEQNLDLAQTAARVAQARAGLGAANAALLPSGNISGQATRAYQSVETPLGRVLNSAPGFDRHGNAYEVNLGANWELDLFGGLRRGREAALAEYQASEAGAAAARLTVAAQTADIYITVRGLQARLDVARKQVKTQQDLVATINLLYGKGLAAELQLRQAEGALAQVQASIPVLESGLETALNALDVMLASPPGTHHAERLRRRLPPAARRVNCCAAGPT